MLGISRRLVQLTVKLKYNQLTVCPPPMWIVFAGQRLVVRSSHRQRDHDALRPLMHRRGCFPCSHTNLLLFNDVAWCIAL